MKQSIVAVFAFLIACTTAIPAHAQTSTVFLDYHATSCTQYTSQTSIFGAWYSPASDYVYDVATESDIFSIWYCSPAPGADSHQMHTYYNNSSCKCLGTVTANDQATAQWTGSNWEIQGYPFTDYDDSTNCLF